MSNEAARRAELIEQILDKIKPIPSHAPDEVKDTIDTERQMLAMQAGWTTMPVVQLENILAGKG